MNRVQRTGFEEQGLMTRINVNFFLRLSMIKRGKGKWICIHGNICAGKSTAIKEKYANYIPMLEKLDRFDPFFAKYNETVAKMLRGDSPTLDDVSNLMEF